MRDYLGHTFITTEQINGYELALGDHGRSGEQFDIWQAVYGPVGEDGYPQPIFNKETGEIDHKVADYWREHYDLEAILERNWSTLGPKLEGKIHIYVGSADTYFLNNAVYRMEDFLKATKNPPYGGEVKYGDRAEHCWNGDPNAAELPVAAALQHDVSAEDHGADSEDGAGRGGCDELEILATAGAPCAGAGRPGTRAARQWL